MHHGLMSPSAKTGQRNEAPKILISATAPVTTDDTDTKPGTFRSGAAALAPVLPVLPVVLAVLAAAALPDGDGVVSPSVSDALPTSELSNSHNWRMFFTSEGRFESAESNTAV